MACYLGLYGILIGVTKSADHPSMSHGQNSCKRGLYMGSIGFYYSRIRRYMRSFDHGSYVHMFMQYSCLASYLLHLTWYTLHITYDSWRNTCSIRSCIYIYIRRERERERESECLPLPFRAPVLGLASLYVPSFGSFL